MATTPKPRPPAAADPEELAGLIEDAADDVRLATGDLERVVRELRGLVEGLAQILIETRRVVGASRREGA
jgi:hypothetical protein